jgi:hypothetical protein
MVDEVDYVGDGTHSAEKRILVEPSRSPANPLDDLADDYIQVIGIDPERFLQTIARTEWRPAFPIADIRAQPVPGCTDDPGVRNTTIKTARKCADVLAFTLRSDSPQPMIVGDAQCGRNESDSAHKESDEWHIVA